MAKQKAKTLVQRWAEDKNPVGIVKGAKTGKKVPIEKGDKKQGGKK